MTNENALCLAVCNGSAHYFFFEVSKTGLYFREIMVSIKLYIP